MSGMPRVLVVAGSTRRESFNRRLARVAAQQVAGAGAAATLLELAITPCRSMTATSKSPPACRPMP